MRRRGTYLLCDVCGQSMFVKNLKNYPFSGWEYDKKLKIDICPSCVTRNKKARQAGMTWSDIIEVYRKKLWDSVLS